ncbi:hypothetical protein [Labedaea rhizosphaerae]|uniref:Uncharacterized protein n=1 Tax=Labedaea rhizosphaerae TaxID=598644 RepID=A0A4V3D088_LABRH|nr:hypothetical protein [Labedaea rhizosphaerae]TDQ04815.1 hypothetical protein EV186_101773 [Labedaea rhizosphaerae]
MRARSLAYLIVGMVLLVLGAQGAIRLLADHDNGGFLGWIPGGFLAQLSCYILIAVVGSYVAARGSGKVRPAERDR